MSKLAPTQSTAQAPRTLLERMEAALTDPRTQSGVIAAMRELLAGQSDIAESDRETRQAELSHPTPATINQLAQQPWFVELFSRTSEVMYRRVVEHMEARIARLSDNLRRASAEIPMLHGSAGQFDQAVVQSGAATLKSEIEEQRAEIRSLQVKLAKLQENVQPAAALGSGGTIWCAHFPEALAAA